MSRMTDRATGIPAPCPHCGYDLREVAGELCPNCGRYITRVDGVVIQPIHWPQMLRSLGLRTLIALPLGLGLLCACVWLTRIGGSAKLQTTPAIILGALFGYGYGFGLAQRAGKVNLAAYIVTGLMISAVVVAAVVGLHILFPQFAADAGPKRFWYASGAFSGTTIMCALIALRVESRATVLLR